LIELFPNIFCSTNIFFPRIGPCRGHVDEFFLFCGFFGPEFPRESSKDENAIEPSGGKLFVGRHPRPSVFPVGQPVPKGGRNVDAHFGRGMFLFSVFLNLKDFCRCLTYFSQLYLLHWAFSKMSMWTQSDLKMRPEFQCSLHGAVVTMSELSMGRYVKSVFIVHVGVLVV